MINIIIYLNKNIEPKQLVFNLLRDKLIAKASIDINNESYYVQDGEIVRNEHTVITAQTKALLFGPIETYIKEKFGEGVNVYAMPITQANAVFDQFIREATQKI
ncbi:MAG: divalent cation tolerance protein CutA [Bacteroidota bacterium]|nr:divalent cation tolerance protein CutA [Bacteroidota bacterium]